MTGIVRRGAAVSARVTSARDPLRVALWAGAVMLVTLAVGLRPRTLVAAGRATLEPFVILAAIILAAALAGRAGLFRLLARALVPDGAPRAATVASVLAFTAVLSALVNLDVAVVVAMPVALRTARRNDISAGWLAAAVAVMANTSSFLLPTSNITNLLLLGRAPVSTGRYIDDSWLPWLLVTALTVMALSAWLGRVRPVRAGAVEAAPTVKAVFDLIPMFLAASGIRALLGPGLGLHGSFIEQFASGSALASAVNNLPAAAALRATGPSGLWAAVLAMAVGPNLFITGSVATLICRRIARDGGASLSVWRFSAMGMALVPAQFAAATLGLRVVGVLR